MSSTASVGGLAGKRRCWSLDSFMKLATRSRRPLRAVMESASTLITPSTRRTSARVSAEFEERWRVIGEGKRLPAVIDDIAQVATGDDDRAEVAVGRRGIRRTCRS